MKNGDNGLYQNKKIPGVNFSLIKENFYFEVIDNINGYRSARHQTEQSTELLAAGCGKWQGQSIDFLQKSAYR